MTIDKVKGILREAPKGFLRVGVFQDAPVEEVVHAVKTLELHRVQLHGSEDPAPYKAAGVPILKAFPVSTAADVEAATTTEADLILFDSRSPLGGGSGQTFDWNLLSTVQRRYFAAGGLNPDNVAELILQLHPYGVDVCSGVEKEPGKKDRNLLKTFVQAARSAEERVFSQLRGR